LHSSATRCTDGGILIALGRTTIFASVVGLVPTTVLVVFADLKARREELWLAQTFAGICGVPPAYAAEARPVRLVATTPGVDQLTQPSR
jgi:hypothetical protein